MRGQQIAASAGAGYNLLARLDSLFTLNGTPAQDKTIADLERAIRGEIEQLKNETLDDKELDRVKAQVIASDVFEKDSVYFQAMVIGILETVGLNWQLRDDYVEKIRSVTAEQVQAAARKYLVDDQLTVAILEPLPLQTVATNNQE